MCSSSFLSGFSGASIQLATWSDVQLLLALAFASGVFAVRSIGGYRGLERRARRQGRLDQPTSRVQAV